MSELTPLEQWNLARARMPKWKVTIHGTGNRLRCPTCGAELRDVAFVDGRPPTVSVDCACGFTGERSL